LITKEDGIHVHKILGILCFGNYIYRIGSWLVCGADRVYIPSNKKDILFWITCHSLLSLSSLIFHLPSKRVRGSPVIWPEYRLHSILFGMRSLLVMFVHVLIKNQWTSYVLRSLVLLGTMVGADVTTHYFGSQEKTMRGMPFPQNTDIIMKNRINMYYSISQALATIKMIYSAEPPYQLVEPFLILFPIQIAAFFMTLVKKGIMTTGGWHFYYAVSLGLNYIYSLMIPFSLNYYPVLVGSIFFCISRFRYRYNKYLLWMIIILFGTQWIR